MRTSRVVPILLALLAAAPLAAQEPEVRVFTSSSVHRARLGVTVDIRADKELDAVGARLRDVLPDGPADKAGLKPGDIVTRLDGQSLAGVKAGDADASGPGERLVELAQKLEPGDTVRVEYRRDGKAGTATVVAAEVGMRHLMRMPELAELPRRMRALAPMAGNLRALMLAGPGGLRLAELNPGLGEYFGTSEGILVLDAPADSTMPLKAGDVIRAIDGRKPQSEEHARRILGSYAQGEQVKLEISRQKRQSTVTWTVPESRGMEWRGAEPHRMRAPVAPKAPRQPRVERS